MIEKKYFGTDGIRGRVGGRFINPELMLKLGWSVGKVLKSHPAKTVLLARDPRDSGYLLESALVSGLSAAGIDTHLLGVLPTPAVAYLTKKFKASAGMMVTASHNPYQDNGVKLFSEDGFKLSDSIEIDIENHIAEATCIPVNARLGKSKFFENHAGHYIHFCKSLIELKQPLDNLKIVLDCANGATYSVAPEIFTALGASLIMIGDQPDGLNINAAHGSTDPKRLIDTVKQTEADLGIAFDGDGDRVLMVDHQGRILDGDELLYIIASQLHSEQQLQGGVVGTLMTNYALEKALADRKVPFIRSQVGDRYVIEALREKAWHLGGESSGHIICLNHVTTGDGIIAALQVLSSMSKQQCDLATLKDRLLLMPQVTVNVPVQLSAKVLLRSDEINAATTQIRSDLKHSGRVLLRPSGTEPVVRIMLEGDELKTLEYYAEQLATLVKSVELRALASS